MTLPSLSRLRIGDYGPDVEFIQSVLGITVSGDFNFITDTAVRAFQAERGITDDGVVDDATWSAILHEDDKMRSTVKQEELATEAAAEVSDEPMPPDRKQRDTDHVA